MRRLKHLVLAALLGAVALGAPAPTEAQRRVRVTPKAQRKAPKKSHKAPLRKPRSQGLGHFRRGETNRGLKLGRDPGPIRLEAPPRFPRDRGVLLTRARRSGKGDARPFTFTSQRQVDRHRASTARIRRANTRNIGRVMKGVIERARAQAAEKKSDPHAFLTAVHREVDRLLRAGEFPLDVSPYVPNYSLNLSPNEPSGADKTVVFQFENPDNPAEHLRMEVWAFKPGDMTTPHEHPRRGGAWVLAGQVAEISYREVGGRKIEHKETTLSGKGGFATVTHRRGEGNHIHALGAPPTAKGITNTLHIYGARVTETARDDLVDPQNLHGQASRMTGAGP